MKARWVWLLGCALFAACGGGSGGGQGSFRLLEFLEHQQNQIPRNRNLTFLFSAPVKADQDFAQRLKIQNVETGANSNFSLAIGEYLVDGDRVEFAPRLPNKEDRSDAGFRANGEYVVFLKAGPDALVSDGGDQISTPQEFIFNTNEFFEDPFPAEPPRVMGLFARDATQPSTAPRVDLSRLDPRPAELALFDNAALISATRFVEPGAGGAPQFATPWRFELELTEPVDPSTVTTDNIEMFEIYSDATTSGETAPPFAPPTYFGTAVNFKVPVNVSVEQKALEGGAYDVKIVVTPLFTLVDNTRYRLKFHGNILGIDFREQFIGLNGLTGDGQTVLSGSTPYPEPGGLGYTVEFLARDRPAITSMRTLSYQPIFDGIDPELGQTTTDPTKYNTALYNPPSNPGTAVGYLGAFGTGKDGNLAVGTGIVTVDTGDTPNAALGKPFSVSDLNPNDDYLNNTLPGGTRTYDSRKPFELNLQSLTVSAGSVLRFIGVNPILLRVQGIVQINGTIDISGSIGQNGGGVTSTGGTGGPGGGAGGLSKRGVDCTYLGQYANCSGSPFSGVLSACGFSNWPYSLNGDGPGRGHAGGSAGGYIYYSPPTYGPNSGTGGGGGSHGTKGTDGQDITSATAAEGTGGNCFAPTYYSVQNSSVVGVRGEAGTLYGDPEVDDVTWGGSGGGAGGATTSYAGFAVNQAGGAGGGGGGSITIFSAGSILATSGRIAANGGAGGNGSYKNYASSTFYHMITGPGGGGSGGTICLVSGENIAATATVLDTSGGAGGAASTLPANCTNCNAGGAGGKGIIFLMDPDGLISGLLPNGAGSYPSFTGGYLTIATFASAGNRFGDTRAVTELFNVLAANPAYLQLDDDPQNVDGDGLDILATVNSGQEILIYASSARPDPADPLRPSIATETAKVLVARVHYALGATQVDADSYMAMDQLNPSGGPARDAYVRIDALYNYTNLVEAALGPFAIMDRVDISYTFNG